MFPRLFTTPALGDFGPFTLHTYGVLLAIAFLVGLWVANSQAKRAGLDAGRITDMAVYVLIAGLVGAKLMLLAVEHRYYLKNPREILTTVLQSGGVFYGGLLGGILVAIYCARLYKLPGWATADVLAPGVVIGQSIGRLGCFAAGCCYGKTADVPWAVTFRDATNRVGTPIDTPLHPTQLYESLATLLIFAVLIWMAPRKKFHGQVVLSYVALYSVARFYIEQFRGDAERGFIGALSTSQAVAVALLVLAVLAFLKIRKTPLTPMAAAPGGASPAA